MAADGCDRVFLNRYTYCFEIELSVFVFSLNWCVTLVRGGTTKDDPAIEQQ